MNINLDFLNHNQRKALTIKTPGLTEFAYIVKKARGVNSKFITLVSSPTGPLALTALLKSHFKYSHHPKPFLLISLLLASLAILHHIGRSHEVLDSFCPLGWIHAISLHFCILDLLIYDYWKLFLRPTLPILLAFSLYPQEDLLLLKYKIIIKINISFKEKKYVNSTSACL